MTAIRNFLHGFHDTTMFLTLMLWLCIAPFVLLFAASFFGWQVGLIAAIITFLLALALCWGVCLFPKISVEDDSNARGSSMR